MFKFISNEWSIIKEVYYTFKDLKYNGIGIIGSMSVMFGFKGRYKIDDGVWIKGNMYKMIRRGHR